MAKVLKVTKADKTVHVTPIANKNTYLHMNNKILSKDQQMKLEEIDEKDAKNLDYIDENYVTGTEAQQKNVELQKEIDALKAQLASHSKAPAPHKADELIAAIEKAATVEEVNTIFNGDARVTVQQAAAKRLAELKEPK